MPHQYTRRPVSERFWDKVNKNGPVPEHCPELGPCWPWTSGRNPKYGTFMLTKGKAVLAHRFAYQLTLGEIPAGLDLMHACDNPPCCNPAHMTPGTRRQNIRDCMNKGRFATGDRSGARLHPETRCNGERRSEIQRRVSPKGEAHWNCRLSDTDVLAIRAELAAGAKGKDVAVRYSVGAMTISKIKNGTRHRNILPH